MKNVLICIGVYILLCILVAVIEHIVNSAISVADYRKTKKAANVEPPVSMFHMFFIILGKSISITLKSLRGKPFHDIFALICMFLIWPVHLICLIIYATVPKLRKESLIIEYKEYYAKIDPDYAKLNE